MTEEDIGHGLTKAIEGIYSLFPSLSKKEFYHLVGDFFHQKAEVKVYSLDKLKEMAEEYISETEHGSADEPATWQEAIRDFVLAVEHWE